MKERQLSTEQQQAIDGYRQRKKLGEGVMKFLSEHRGKHFCGACETEIAVNEDARPSQVPRYCTECERLFTDGLMALASGRLYETMESGKRCFKEGDGYGCVTGADVRTVTALLSDDPTLVSVRAGREGNMTRLVMYAVE